MARSNIKWRLCRKAGDTALSAEQVQHLAVKCQLDPGELTLLSADLAWALNPHNRPRDVINAKTSKQQGAEVFNEAMRDISKAAGLLQEARIKLRSLTMSVPLNEDTYESPHQYLFRRLIKAHVDTSVIEDLFKEAAEAGMSTFLRGPSDKRLIRDERRVMVCAAIVRFWDKVGRTESFTTDGVSSERKGKLVDFIKAVVALVTDPPFVMSGETIKGEIVKVKHQLALERQLSSGKGVELPK